ncbi:uncharacterized protein L3040_006688 [Drepanopeziza brunnea f. sp. 'multigermtubi']|uniref:2EXR domain-containing protein n=1 Tax=Marssonina brunnea f. sp. multigermtubi (strain MB_m1) TaxID=1072389 RepID=K1XXN6_MARBU|nr:uncharacterized protein MBM_04430 [Drepanopeziza brunnea f. sp. 'multigermtubi' MB_m1]EKD17569.1 hypothetical protein MBM_04430 [Drepanopeziza brunnea f. sp. 'multigermtubi' MB_m1]KAJ5039016.1 hypothetical protein L3040_006688 [Drepanopeziza brunnea f. sp. 'multigermtubi']
MVYRNDNLVTSTSISPELHYLSYSKDFPTFASLEPTYLSQFDPFPRLPIELRYMIWGFALPEERPIYLSDKKYKPIEKSEVVAPNPDSHVSDAGSLDRDETGESVKHPETSKNIPALLLTSHEARRVALKHLTLNLGFQLADKPVYVNLNRDTVHFKNTATLMLLVTVQPLWPRRTNTGNGMPVKGDYYPLERSDIENNLRHLFLCNTLRPTDIKMLARFRKLETITVNTRTTLGGGLSSNARLSVAKTAIRQAHEDALILWKQYAGVLGGYRQEARNRMPIKQNSRLQVLVVF